MHAQTMSLLMSAVGHFLQPSVAVHRRTSPFAILGLSSCAVCFAPHFVHVAVAKLPWASTILSSCRPAMRSSVSTFCVKTRVRRRLRARRTKK